MPTVRLTARSVDSAKPPSSGQLDLWDAGCPGLGLRISSRGTKSWTVLYRAGGQQRRATLGRYDDASPQHLSLGEAREKARALLTGTPRPKRAVEDTAAEFIERYARPRNRGWQRQQTDLRREFVDRWKGRDLASVEKREIIAILDHIADRTSPQRANRYLALIKRFFGWCVERDYLPASPAATIKPPGRALSRDRVLSAEELRLIWTGCERDGWPFGDLTRFLTLTAQRLGEVASMQWRDVDLERAIWTVPAEIAKNGVANEVPLPSPALNILRGLPSRRAGYVFPAQNGSANAVSGFSRFKGRLDRDIAAEHGAAIPPWRIHDLRRSAATNMAELRVPPHTIEHVLNHVSGSRAGVAGVYNRYGYLPEKRHALEVWAQYIETVTRASPDNVIPLAKAAG
jgi:integrase